MSNNQLALRNQSTVAAITATASAAIQKAATSDDRQAIVAFQNRIAEPALSAVELGLLLLTEWKVSLAAKPLSEDDAMIIANILTSTLKLLRKSEVQEALRLAIEGVAVKPDGSILQHFGSLSAEYIGGCCRCAREKLHMAANRGKSLVAVAENEEKVAAPPPEPTKDEVIGGVELLYAQYCAGVDDNDPYLHGLGVYPRYYDFCVEHELLSPTPEERRTAYDKAVMHLRNTTPREHRALRLVSELSPTDPRPYVAVAKAKEMLLSSLFAAAKERGDEFFFEKKGENS